jgi:L-lactate utilization protein LutB
MENKNKWNAPAKKAVVEKTKKALNTNGISVSFAKDKDEAMKITFNMIPFGAEVMNMSSITLEETGIAKKIMESPEFDSVKNKLSSMNKDTQKSEIRKLGASPDYAVGSVHAITEDGKLVIASNTGSQLPAYAYGAGKVIFVVGTQKIVKNINEAIERIEKYVFPLEDKRMMRLDNSHSNISKMLIINKEIQPERITIIFVNEVLGF